jgi:hypothetical protein
MLWSYTSTTLHTIMAVCFAKHDNFTCIIYNSPNSVYADIGFNEQYL